MHNIALPDDCSSVRGRRHSWSCESATQCKRFRTQSTQTSSGSSDTRTSWTTPPNTVFSGIKSRNFDQVTQKIEQNCGRCAKQRTFLEEASSKLQAQQEKENAYENEDTLLLNEYSSNHPTSSTTPILSNSFCVCSQCKENGIESNSCMNDLNHKRIHRLCLPHWKKSANNIFTLRKSNSLQSKNGKKLLAKSPKQFNDHSSKSLDDLLQKSEKENTHSKLTRKYFENSSKKCVILDDLSDRWEELSEIIIPGNRFQLESRKLLHSDENDV